MEIGKIMGRLCGKKTRKEITQEKEGEKVHQTGMQR
jgi:hypothetical protein